MYMLVHHLVHLSCIIVLIISGFLPLFYDTMKFLSSCILGLCILYKELSTAWYTKLVRTVSHQRKNTQEALRSPATIPVLAFWW